MAKAKYEMIASRKGAYTIKLVDSNREIFLHSKYDPIKESKRFAEAIYDKNAKVFLVIGIGLGYHIKSLSNMLRKNQKIFALESSSEIYKLADNKGLYDEIRKSHNVEMILADNFNSYIGSLHEIIQLNGVKLVIHDPYLNVFTEEYREVKELIEDFRIKERTIEQNRKKLTANFRSNIQNIQYIVDDLWGKYSEQALVMVAAGPSLDKNIDVLHKLKKEVPIIAVGRAVQPLVKAGIVPSYIVITEPKENTYNRQIKNIEEVKKTPIIGLSTADEDIFEMHPGDKYIAFQSGVEESEVYAKKNNLSLIETGGSVATAAFDIAVKMGSNPIIMIGQDLAHTDGLSHSTGTWHSKTATKLTTRKVKGYNGGLVNTSRNLNIYLRWFELRIKELKTKKADMIVIDATEGGANIKGSIKKSLKECIIKYSLS